MKRLIGTAILFGFACSALAHDQAEDTAFGRAADPKNANRTVRIEMSDQMHFAPNEVRVRQGEVVRFVAVNTGSLKHEMVLGTMDELNEHAALMRKFPGMEHDEPNMADVAPGASGEIVWQFTKTGEFYYGCLMPGHFEAGMVGKVIVTQ